MLDFLVWFFSGLVLAFRDIAVALANPGAWLNWSDPEAMMRFIYYGASANLFFVVTVIVIALTVAGILYRPFMWGTVRVLEGIANGVGRIAAWAGLLMVLQQILIIFLQRIFRVADITISPFGYEFTQDLSWYSEELKLYNAIVVTLCVTWTFVQGSHVRVDLVYSAVSFRAKRIIDMFGSLFFMLPMAALVYFYSWFFMWRSLITPKVSASDSLELLLRKARIVKWNVETIGFSPNGFNAYFLFKVLMVTFAILVFLQAIAFFYRSFLEFSEGEDSADKYLDRDSLGDDRPAAAAT